MKLRYIVFEWRSQKYEMEKGMEKLGHEKRKEKATRCKNTTNAHIYEKKVEKQRK